MTASAMIVEPFDFAGASEREYKAVNEFANILRAENLPDDPPTPLAETIASLQNIPPFITAFAWNAWNSEKTEIIGSANVGFMDTDENKHLVWLDISVLPERRREGIGRRLLSEAVRLPEREGRRLIMTGTNARVPAGDAFLEKLGGERGMEGHTNQLVLDELDRALLTEWMIPDSAGRFALDFWTGPHPEDLLPAITLLMENATNTSPRDALDMEDMHFTPEQMRQMEQQTFAGGNERWTLAAREVGTEKLAGFTETVWNASSPQIVHQGGTGVYPEFRGRGLGKRLKAAMLDRLLRERPDAKVVRTGNADSNGPHAANQSYAGLPALFVPHGMAGRDSECAGLSSEKRGSLTRPEGPHPGPLLKQGEGARKNRKRCTGAFQQSGFRHGHLRRCLRATGARRTGRRQVGAADRRGGGVAVRGPVPARFFGIIQRLVGARNH